MNPVEFKPKALKTKWVFEMGGQRGGKTNLLNEMLRRANPHLFNETEDIEFEEVTNLLPEPEKP